MILKKSESHNCDMLIFLNTAVERFLLSVSKLFNIVDIKNKIAFLNMWENELICWIKQKSALLGPFNVEQFKNKMHNVKFYFSKIL